MDPAEEFEAEFLSRQKAVHEATARGDSAVQLFYRDATVFVTGGSGFLGKQLIEKFFRSCDIKKMYVLLRFKKGKTMQERLDHMLRDPVFDLVRVKHPHFADRIVGVAGDITKMRLGLTDHDWTTITAEVNVVVHLAATIRFNEPLRVATLTNIRGTREAVAFAKECTKLKSFVYVSTAFCHATQERVGKEVLEQFYPCPVPPDVMIALAEESDDEKLNNITPELIKGWPNTYTFTKAIAEELVRTSAADLPTCVVKPPIVLCSYLEPAPGWVDMSCLMGPLGILAGVILGVIHVIFVDVKNKLAFAPVDYVNNAIIMAGWDSAERRNMGDHRIPLYNISNKHSLINWSTFGYILRNDSRKFSTPKAVGYCFSIETKNRLVRWILTWLLHYIPGYVIDGVCALVPVKPKGIPSFVKIYSKIENMSYLYKYFMTNSWEFHDENVRAMIKKMSETDKAIFNCDMMTLDYNEYVNLWVISIRKFIIKDGLKGSVAAFKRQKVLRAVNYMVLLLFLYISWWTIWKIKKIF